MISKEFKEDIANGSVVKIRSALLDALIIDPSFQTFDEAFAFAEKQINILEEHDNEPFSEMDMWNEDYLNQQKVALMMNFSQERIDHLKQVIKVVLPAESVTSAPIGNSNTQSGFSQTNDKRVVKEKETPKATESTHRVYGKPRLGRRPMNQKTADSFGSTDRLGAKETTDGQIPTQNAGSAENILKFDTETALIAFGVAAVVVGTVVPKSVIVGAGVVAAGVGCALKIAQR